MNELVRVTFSYGKSKKAYLNPAALLLLFGVNQLRRFCIDIDNALHKQGIIFVFSENGDAINLVAAISFLPGGYRNNNNGTFNNLGNNGNLWSSTENSSTNAWNRNLNYNNTQVNRNNNNKQNGFSVRCVRDLKFKVISLSFCEIELCS